MFLFGKKKAKKEKRKIPKSVQQTIPIDRLYKDGIFKCGHTYSKTWRFTDINYAVASDDDQLSMFLAHSALINGLPTDALAKISVFNRTLSREVLSSLAVPNGDAGYEVYANELAEIFNCVPSQINYVIQTRFTKERGYNVESRRGGGGFIRITKVKVRGDEYIMHIINSIGSSLDYGTARALVSNLLGYNKITEREAKIILASLSDNILPFPAPIKNEIRSAAMKNILINLI